MARLNLRLLGDFEVRLGSGPALRLRARKTQALLAYLASCPGQTHSRDKLASLLWGDRSQPQARSHLRGTLFVLRRTLALADPPCLALDGEAIALNGAAVDVDAVAFARLATTNDAEALAKAVELYRGDFLEGLAFRGALFEDWLVAERERLRELAVDALAKLLAHQQRSAEPESALQTALRLIALDPLQEPVHRSLMRLYDRLGRRGVALRQYQICVGVLRRELGVEPEADTKQLYRELVRRQPQGPAKAPDTKRPHRRPYAEQPRLDLFSKDSPLIGREAERAQLRQALEEAEQGHGCVFTVVGEAGVGKTSVVGTLAADATARGAQVLLGRCYESASILPFGPWVDAFRTGRTLDDDGLLDELRPVWRSELARLLPEADTAGLPAPSDNQLRLFEGVAHLIECLAARRTLVLMLEDIHWADEMSLRLLAFISRRIGGWRALVLTTAREQELADASMARRTLEELRREPHATSLELAPLSRPDTALLVRSLSRSGSDAAALTNLEEHVWALSEGNPFVAVETMRALHEGSILESSTTLPLPKRVRDLIAERLGRLSDRGRQLAAVAAVIGREFDFALLQRAAGCDEAGAAEGVEELVRRNVLRVTDSGFDFTHDRVRALIHSELLPPQLKLLHRQIGAALEALHADDLEIYSAALGTHYLAGEVWEKAARYLWQAGVKRSDRRAYREAATAYEQALDALGHLGESPDTEQSAVELRLGQAGALYQLGEFESALVVLDQAETQARKLDDRARLARVLSRMSSARRSLGNLQDALAAARQSVEIATELADPVEQASASSALAVALFMVGDLGQAADVLRHDVETLALGPALEIQSRAQLARVLGRRGEFSEGQRLGEEALRLAVEDGRGTLPLIAHGSLGQLYLTKGDWEAAIRVLEAGRALGRASDDRDFSEIMAGDLGFAYGWTGRLAEGLALLEEALKAALQRRARLFESTHARKLSTVYLLAGRLDEARQHAYQALDLARQQKAREIEANALFALAEVHTHASPADVQQAETAYRDALALAEPRGMRPPHRPLQTRPRQALAAHGPARAGAGASHHRDDDVPGDGDDVLAEAGRGRGGGGTGLSSQAG